MSAFERERQRSPLPGGLTLHKAAEPAFVAAWIAYRASQDAAFGALADLQATLVALLPLLHTWSDPAKPWRVQMIAAEYLGSFEAQGGTVSKIRRRMIRPVSA